MAAREIILDVSRIDVLDMLFRRDAADARQFQDQRFKLMQQRASAERKLREVEQKTGGFQGVPYRLPPNHDHMKPFRLEARKSPSPEAHPEVALARRELKEISAQLTELEAAAQIASEHRNASGALLKRCKEFARERGHQVTDIGRGHGVAHRGQGA